MPQRAVTPNDRKIASSSYRHIYMVIWTATASTPAYGSPVVLSLLSEMSAVKYFKTYTHAMVDFSQLQKKKKKKKEPERTGLTLSETLN